MDRLYAKAYNKILTPECAGGFIYWYPAYGFRKKCYIVCALRKSVLKWA